MVKKREPYRKKNKSVFHFQFLSRTVPYRNMVRLPFFNGKNGKIDNFWFGTVRAFCKKSKNGTLFRTVRFAVKKINGKLCLNCNGTVHAFEPKNGNIYHL